MKARYTTNTALQDSQHALEQRTLNFVKSGYCTCFHDVHAAVDNVVTVQRAAAALERALVNAERTLNDLEHAGEMIPPFERIE